MNVVAGAKHTSVGDFVPFLVGCKPLYLRACMPGDDARSVDVSIIPTAHAATTDFYDMVLGEVRKRVDAAEANPARPTSVLLEGLCEDEAQVQLERDEWRFIAVAAAVTRRLEAGATDDLTAEEKQQSEEARRFYTHFTNRIAEGTLYTHDSISGMAGMYGLAPQWLRARGLELQDAYMRPRLALHAAHALRNSDLVVALLPPAARSALDASEKQRQAANDRTSGVPAQNQRFLHALRERACADSVRAACAEILDNPENTGGEVVVLWGHFHCPRIASALVKGDAGSSATPVRFEEVGVAPDPYPYGWSPASLIEMYGSEAVAMPRH
jgi:hypothetical protein